MILEKSQIILLSFLLFSSIVTYLNLNKWKVVFWGRSMGAATALKYGKAPIIIADSSFSCFKSLC